ncbi:CPBP family intramembrane glutamic endopeptidase [Aminipila terrae]|uniref:CPBP family intramembrane metalloprotease n=1 Tax=Aminipila terrae TaxID=2697030 RepID=A0A6P1MH04_9FIRM|nr:type II CAAX endopeptidase family protein [Aminipila terrae]QHI73021.1 CPBP family intramembrane metalloprotease [Aminipila terrae]
MNMNALFDKIKISKIILIYICAIVFTFIILRISFFKNIYANDKFFAEIILNTLVLAWFIYVFYKEELFNNKKFIYEIKKINYKKIAHLYFLNIGMYIGLGLCFFVGDKSLIRVPSALYVIFGITLAPVVEELIFRGVILNRLKLKFSSISSVFVSAIIFGIVHMDLNILGRIIFGILCAIMYLQTKSIMNCMVFHALNNASLFILPIVSKYTHFTIKFEGQTETSVIILIIFICFAISILLDIIYIKNNLLRKN